MSFAVPQTPQRPLPGAYVQTPAHGLTSHTGQIGQSSPWSGALSPPRQYGSQKESQVIGQPRQQNRQIITGESQEGLTPVERASRAINETLNHEKQYPELDSYVSQGPSSDYEIFTQPAWAPFQKIRDYNIPTSIFEQYNHAQVSTMMGLFANIKHAWVSIDSSLYLWDYTQPNPELIGFEELSQNITAVRIVTPRAGVFLPSITHLLVVATTNELLLVGLATRSAPNGSQSVSLYSTRLSLSFKTMSISIIEGSSATGRIFFSENGNDDVYELTYQQEEKWFQNRCAKINHTGKSVTVFNPGPIFSFGQKAPRVLLVQMAADDTRNLLYTLSSQSTIRVFHQTENNGLSLMITKTLGATLNDIGHIPNLATDLLSSSISIASIDPISSQEASRLHLMATTSTGCRIFMSATSNNSYNSYSFSISNASNAPTSMQVQHVKFPSTDPSRPQLNQQQNSSQTTLYGNTQGLNSTSKALVKTRKAVRYAPGYFICLVPRDRHDLMFISAPDTARISDAQKNSRPPRYPELGLWLKLGGRAEDIGLSSPRFGASSSPAGFGNELAVQYDAHSSEVAILTNTGVHTYRRRRLVDVFASVVKVGGGDEGVDGEIKKFIRMYGPGETASTALAVACGQGVDVTSDYRVANITDPGVLDLARKAFIEYGGKPEFNENFIVDQSTSTIDSIRPSPRHRGLSLYVARLIRSIWKVTILRESTSPAGFSVVPVVSMAILQKVSQDLLKLKEFLALNKSFIDGLAGPDALTRASTKQEETLLQAEHRALHSMVVLIENIIEGVAFVQVLFNEQIAEIVLSLTNETRVNVRELTYEGLVSTMNGKEIAKELVKAIVNRNIANGSNIETIAEALRRRCGSFCSADDVIIFKAQELLKRAADNGSDLESSRNLLNESLRLFEQVASSLTLEQLQWAVHHFTILQFYAGAVRLALRVAQEVDRGNRALAWIQEGRPDQDLRATAFKSRKPCYDLIHEVINNLDQASSQAPGVVDGQVTLAARRRTEAYDVIDDSDDEAFQTNLYDWYLSQGRTDRLLEVQSAYIVTYLRRKASDDIAHADLLWKYYSQSDQNHEAAAVQLSLANSTFTLSLDRRIEYLGRAAANASTPSSDIALKSSNQVKNEASDLLDVANIQSDLLQRLKMDDRVATDRKFDIIKELDGQLLPLSTLYNQYADQASYFDLCLLIYQAADHRNPTDIRATWQNLLDSTHEETTVRGEPQPYEAVIEKIRSLGTTLKDPIRFPIDDLLPMLEGYAIEYQSGVGPDTWVVDTFLDIGIPFETLFFVLQGMYYNDEAPFQGRNRRYIANDIIYVVQMWFQDSSRGAEPILGGESSAVEVSQTLHMLLQSGMGDRKREDCQVLRMRIEQVLR